MRKHRLVTTIVVLILTVNLMLICNSQLALAATKTALNNRAIIASFSSTASYKNVNGYVARKLILKHGSYTLKEGTDYTVDTNKITVYKNGSSMVMKYPVKAVASSTKYSGSVDITLANPPKAAATLQNVTAKTSLGSNAVTVSVDIYSAPYKNVSGYAARKLILKHGNYTLKENVDYTISNISVARRYVDKRYIMVMSYTIKAMGDKYTGTKTFAVNNPPQYNNVVVNNNQAKKQISTATVQFYGWESKSKISTRNYTGSALKFYLNRQPLMTLYNSSTGAKLTLNKDYKITTQRTEYKTYAYIKIVIQGMGDYTGSRNVYYYLYF